MRRVSATVEDEKMRSFVGLGFGLSIAALAFGAGCSSSPSSGSEPDSGSPGNGADSGGLADTGASTDAAGGQDTGAATDSGQTSQDAGSCMAIALADGGVPTFTAPALDQGVCAAADIATFVTACGGGNATNCGMWEQTNAVSACGKCLFSQNDTVAPVEAFVLGNIAHFGPAAGACVLAASGSAAAGCAAAIDETEYCVNYVCSSCTAATGAACVASATGAGGPCASASNGVQSACATYASSAQSCLKGATAALSATATAICGSGSTDGGADQ